MHEASLHRANSFLTLTYDDSHYPTGGSLNVRDIQLFFKRLRKSLGRVKVRFFQVGEYGEDLDRPHHHVCLFGWDFSSDRYMWKVTDHGTLYRSPSLEELWGAGFCLIGDVTFKSAAYVARYVMKKVGGDMADGHYEGRKPEFATMSRRPGLGRAWYDSFKSDLFPRDFAVHAGKKLKVPDYYTNLLKVEDPALHSEIKAKRRLNAVKLVEEEVNGDVVMLNDNDAFRLAVKEQVKRSQLGQLSRPLEE